MITRPIASITKADIEALVANQVREGRTLEYKSSLPGSKDDDKREFLADVSSFANSMGGDLVYGVSETDGVAHAATGLHSVDVDAEILRLESIARDGIEPRLPDIRTQPVAGFTHGPVIVLRVPNSWLSPHMVTLKNLSRFYTRSSAGKYQMDVQEIRSAFALSEDLPERIRKFRDERVSRVLAGDTPVGLDADPKIVLHVVPIAAFSAKIQLQPRAIKQQEQKLHPIGGRSRASRYNVDGFVTYTQPDGGTNALEYCQVFRNGVIEAVDAHTLSWPGAKVLPHTGFEQAIAKSVGDYLSALVDLDVPMPAFVSVCLLGVRGYQITASRLKTEIDPTPIDRDKVILPDVLVESAAHDVRTALRPIFDAFWNAAGYPGSPTYDEPDGQKP